VRLDRRSTFADALTVTTVAADPRPARGAWFRFRYWVLAVVAVLLLGSAGYMVLEGWSASDALFMTVITVTTVGFQEVRPLDGAGRVLTMAVAGSGVALLFGGLGLAAEAVVSEAASGRLAARREAAAIESLREHVLICGFGRVGSTVATELRAAGIAVLVIDREAGPLEAARSAGLPTLAGDAASDSLLRAAGIERARGLVAAMDSDANNVYVVLSARSLAPTILIVARATNLEAESKLRQAGADRVVSPYVMAGHRLAALVTRPGVVEFIDAAMRGGAQTYTLEEVTVRPGSTLEGLSVADLAARGVAVLAIHGQDETGTPAAERKLATGDEVVLAGPSKVLEGLRE
jgi:voltage-gated potassium channel